MRTAPRMWLPWPWEFSLWFPRPTAAGLSGGPVPMRIGGSRRTLFHHDGVTICAVNQRMRPSVIGIRNAIASWSRPMINTDRFRVGRLRQSIDHVAEASWGSILYRGATTIAVLIIVLALGNYLYNLSQNRPLLPLMPFVLAGVIWLIGCFLR